MFIQSFVLFIFMTFRMIRYQGLFRRNLFIWSLNDRTRNEFEAVWRPQSLLEWSLFHTGEGSETIKIEQNNVYHRMNTKACSPSQENDDSTWRNSRVCRSCPGDSQWVLLAQLNVIRLEVTCKPLPGHWTELRVSQEYSIKCGHSKWRRFMKRVYQLQME